MSSSTTRTMTPLSALLVLLAVHVLAPASVYTRADIIAASNTSSPSTAGVSTESVAATTNTTLCDSQLLFQKLYVLMPAINQCAMESDYFIKPDNLSLPSDKSLDKFCSSRNCSELSVELDNAGLPSCSVPVGNSTMQFKVFFKEIKAHCDSAAKTPESATPSSGTSRHSYRIVDTGVWHVATAAVLVAVVAVGVL